MIHKAVQITQHVTSHGNQALGALVLLLVVAVRKQELLFVNEVMAQLFQIATVQALNLQTLKLVTQLLVQHTAGKLDHGALVLLLVVVVHKQELLVVSVMMV